LDRLLIPYVERLCTSVLISVTELDAWGRRPLPSLPLLLDSGGLNALRADAVVEEQGGLGTLRLHDGFTLTPQRVHDLQTARGASVGFTLDFPARSGAHDLTERQALSLNNALWALAQPRTFRLYASVQPGQPLAPYLAANPDGIALGGLAPYSGNRERLAREVRAARQQMPAGMPLHVFGVGALDSIRTVMDNGATSTDSSSPQRNAAAGRFPDGGTLEDAAPQERLGIALLNLRAAIAEGRSARLPVGEA